MSSTIVDETSVQDISVEVNVQESSEVVPRASYAAVARNGEDLPVAYVDNPDNELPSQPLTAFFNPRVRLPAADVFEAQSEAGIDGSEFRVYNVKLLERSC